MTEAKDNFKRMVVGFVFGEDLRSVLLIRKNKPEWQRGLFNGVGGKCKELEPPRLAMTRELEEETGLVILPHQWTEFVTLYTGKPDAPESIRRIYAEVTVHFFFVTAPHEVLVRAESKTAEQIMIQLTKCLCDTKTIPNLQWLIPLAARWNENLLPVRYANPIEVFEDIL